MAPSGAGKDEDKGVAEIVSDLWQLVKDYAKQETVDPIKAALRFMAIGVGGTLLLALGVAFISLGVLRGLQTQTDDLFTGNWTWVPYALTLVIDVFVILLAVMAIKRPFKTEEARA